jgi:hypothetical protein
MTENQDHDRLIRLEAELAALDRLVHVEFDNRDKAVMVELRERDKALGLHEQELAAHLDRLNHSKEELISERADYLTVAVFRAEHSTLLLEFGKVKDEFIGFKARLIGIAIGAGLGGGLITGMIIKWIEK